MAEPGVFIHGVVFMNTGFVSRRCVRAYKIRLCWHLWGLGWSTVPLGWSTVHLWGGQPTKFRT
jgi:hypothetical protein